MFIMFISLQITACVSEWATKQWRAVATAEELFNHLLNNTCFPTFEITTSVSTPPSLAARMSTIFVLIIRTPMKLKLPRYKESVAENSVVAGQKGPHPPQSRLLLRGIHD